MIASIPSATLLGVRGRPVLVEVHVSNGLPGFTVVGLPDAACREARDRVRAALLARNSPPAVTARLSPDERAVLEALEDVATPFESVCGRSGLGLALTAVTLERLATLGLAARSGSGWERSAAGRR